MMRTNSTASRLTTASPFRKNPTTGPAAAYSTALMASSRPKLRRMASRAVRRARAGLATPTFWATSVEQASEMPSTGMLPSATTREPMP